MGGLGLLFALTAAALVVFGVFLAFASRYKKCPSDKILVIYGNVGEGNPPNATTAAEHSSGQ